MPLGAGAEHRGRSRALARSRRTRATAWASRALVCLAIVSALAAGAQDAAAQAVEPQPSVELPADLERVLRDYERHWEAGNARELSLLFVEDGLIVRGSWIRGRAAIEAAYQTAGGPLRLRAVEYGQDGDVAFIAGAYGYAETDPVVDRGLFVLTLRRTSDGPWLIVSDMDRGIG